MHLNLTPSAILTLMKLSRETRKSQHKLIITALKCCDEIISDTTLGKIAGDMIDLSNIPLKNINDVPSALKMVLEKNPYLQNLTANHFADLLESVWDSIGKPPSKDTNMMSLKEIQDLEVNESEGVWADEGTVSLPMHQRQIMDTVNVDAKTVLNPDEDTLSE